MAEKQKRQNLRNGYHVMTVRFLPEDWTHLLEVQSRRQKKEKRKVPLTEIIVGRIRTLP